jgi:hypothetical protein
LIGLWGVPAGLAHAQIDITAAEAIDGTEYDDETGEVKEHPRGTYVGVAPGGDQLPALPAKPGEGKAAITWPGFQMRPDGTSRFFIQSTRPLVVSSEFRANRAVIDLGKPDLVGENTALPLETRFFNTPVTRATVVRNAKGTQLVLDMRANVQPRITSERAKSGFHFLYLDFPAGQYLGPAETKALGAASSAASDQPTRYVEAPMPKPMPTAKDDERPPGMGEMKAKGSASGSTSTGDGKAKAKAKADGKAKAGFSL